MDAPLGFSEADGACAGDEDEAVAVEKVEGELGIGEDERIACAEFLEKGGHSGVIFERREAGHTGDQLGGGEEGEGGLSVYF